jgi:Zn-dependent peptidase ImmA (M78 family)
MPSEIKNEAARDAGRLLREAWGRPIPVDPAFIARAAGLRVIEAALDEATLGALIKQPNEDPIIMLNESDSPNRKRFTCAHEIGHFVRRSGKDDEYTRIDLRGPHSATGEDQEEVYANEFAACLLMPEDEVRRLHKDKLTELEMSIRFGVSREAMHIRLDNLKLAA